MSCCFSRVTKNAQYTDERRPFADELNDIAPATSFDVPFCQFKAFGKI